MLVFEEFAPASLPADPVVVLHPEGAFDKEFAGGSLDAKTSHGMPVARLDDDIITFRCEDDLVESAAQVFPPEPDDTASSMNEVLAFAVMHGIAVDRYDIARFWEDDESRRLKVSKRKKVGFLLRIRVP